jgi:hypothetical protein
MHTRHLQSLLVVSCLFVAAAAQAQSAAPVSPSEPAVLAMNVPDTSDAPSARRPNPPPVLPGAPATDATIAPTAAIAVASRPAPVAAITPVETRTWRSLVLAAHSAAIFDAWSTRYSLSQGRGYERDPLMRPFAGNGSVYAATQVAPTGLDFLSHRMLRSRNPFLRKTWWIPQTAFTAGSIWVGVRNVHVANGH